MSSALVKGCPDRLPPMREFESCDHFARSIVEDGNASGAATRIELDAQRLHAWGNDGTLEDQGEWIAFEHGCLSSGEQSACPAWVDWIKWLLVGIYEKDLGHPGASFLPVWASACAGDGGLVKVIERFGAHRTGLTALALFNGVP